MTPTVCIRSTAANSAKIWIDMPEELKAKPMSASQISIAQLMQPEHANNLGNVHGGWIMKLIEIPDSSASLSITIKPAL